MIISRRSTIQAINRIKIPADIPDAATYMFDMIRPSEIPSAMTMEPNVPIADCLRFEFAIAV